VLLVQLEGFVAVASRGNVTRAARDLGISQPALTARVRTLERELGVTLLTRGSRGVKLTDEGRELLPYAERVVGAAGEATRAISRVRGGGAGVIDIGAAPSVGTYVLPGVLQRFRARNPGAQINVRTGHSEEILDMVLRERVHVGVVRALRHPDIEATPLYEDELALVVNPAHPFARRPDIRIEELGEQQLILFDRASSYHDLTSAFIREAGVRPRGVMELDNIDAAKKMVEHGLGVALLPRTAIAAELEDGLMRTVAIRDSAPPRRQIVVIRRRDVGAASPTLASFLETLAESTPAEVVRSAS
jgi:DNA-binding transcriptional LysR family regulator